MVRALLIGCAVALVVVGCAGVRSGALQEEQGRTEATKEQAEEGRCGETQPIDLEGHTYTTNDVSGCPKGGLLSGTDELDKLDGEDGDDEIHGLGAKDWIFGGLGSDVIYGEDGDDSPLEGGAYGPYPDESSKDVLHGGPGNDEVSDQDGGDDIDAFGIPEPDRQRDELYCGEGEDTYIAEKLDYVDSSCEVKDPPANL